MNIAVVGTGYVGLVTGACFSEFGNHVICVDNDANKIAMLERNVMPIYEPGLDALVERNVKAGRLEFTTDLKNAVERALVVFIAVGTPQGNDGRADLSYVREVARAVAENLNSYKVVVTKSTVPAGTGTTIRDIIEKNRKETHSFSVASNPEFLREGSAIEDFLRPNRVVIGCEDETAAAIMKDLYRPLYLIETPVVVTNVVTAEVIKYASNAFLATKISFINEMADLCEKVGADVHDVARGMGLDQRIGRKFLHPGPGYGGSCFPKDTRAILELARDYDVPLRIVEAVIDVNARRIATSLGKIRKAVGGALKGKTVGLLGLTFKPNTDDLRESPAMAILEGMLAEGAKVQAYEIIGMPIAAQTRRDGVRYCDDEYQAASGTDALVVATEWNQFRAIDTERLRATVRTPVIVDLRNIYEPETMRAKGFVQLHRSNLMALFVVTGGGGFIGSNLVEALLARGERVRVLDNFATGRRGNLEAAPSWAKAGGGSFELLPGDIRELATCRSAVAGADYVLHQAAIPSVQRSVKDPIGSNEVNVSGTLNLLVAARDEKVKRFVMASSSSLYGESETLPKVETMTPAPLSPYGLQKLAGETYCGIFHRLYGLATIALRYFNVFGPRQDPASEYSAVIPRFITAIKGKTEPTIFGDGEQTRDFSYIANVVQANLRSCEAGPAAHGGAFNIACGERISLNELARILGEFAGREVRPRYAPDRPGDIKHSLAGIERAQRLLGYRPDVAAREGLRRTWDEL